MARIIDLTPLLLQAKQNVTLAKSPYEEFRWLLIQATIEGMIANYGQKISVNGTVEKPNRKRVAVKV
jgi:hypothetical protein